MSSEQPSVVVVTGASAGIGRATARAFATRLAVVGLVLTPPAFVRDRGEAHRRGGWLPLWTGNRPPDRGDEASG